MNYRHAFHAGNHADVFKHVVLLEVLRLLLAKPAPVAYLESHAGAGAYALGENAEKTGEWREGIGRVWGTGDAPAAVSRYLDAVRSWNEGADGLRRYPGSPGLAADALRADDRMVLCETQNDVADELAKRLADHDPRVRVIRGDGYHNALKALMPPPERRALVLVDPPYESQQAEFDVIISALRDALKRFATGTYAVWYPIKHAGLIAPFTRSLASLPGKSVIRVELWVRATNSPLRLNGSGMALVNPPWPFAADVQQWLPWLSKKLAADRNAGWRSEWLKRESTA